MIIHDKSELETILRNTRNNCNNPITYGNNKYKLYNHISCIGDIIEELNLDTEKYYFYMDSIEEHDRYYKFVLYAYNQKHGAYAVYCLESIQAKKYSIVINK